MIGGAWPVSVQTMWKSPLRISDTELLQKAVNTLQSLSDLGCDVVRFAVPDEEAVETFGLLASRVSMPLVADIHFDWRLALRCMDFPVSKIRINPGNIGASWKVAEVVAKAKDKAIPIRIGVNAGSLPEDLRDIPSRAQAVVMAAEREVEALDRLNFFDIVVSMKVSDVNDTIEANRLFSQRHDLPLHLGVTEAGPLVPGIVRNTAALVPLLLEGIGSTIRVSLSDSMENEVIAAREILACAGLGSDRITLVSCPRCARAGFDTHEFTSRWAPELYSIQKSITIAIMGCVVNGPGEGRHADLGITGVGDKVILFKKGTIVATCDARDADEVFRRELEILVSES